MPSFLDYLDLPALQTTLARTAARQAGENLAVQPEPVLAPLAQAARQRAEAGRTLALGEQRLELQAQALPLRRRQLALEASRLDLAAQQAAFEQRLEPFAYGVGALEVGTKVLGGIRQQEALRRQEAMQASTEAIQERQLALQRSQVEKQAQSYGALRLLLEHPAYYLGGP